MSQTQLASLRLGAPYIPKRERTDEPNRANSVIHITNGRTDDIIGFFTQKDTTFNEHTQNLETYQDSFEFTTFGDHKYAHTLTDMNRVIIPAEDGGYSEYVINTARKSRGRSNQVRVKTFASYQMLSVAKVIRPTSLSAYTPSQVLGFIANDTEWRPGITESNATRTFHIENHTDRLSFLKTVANEFELEIRFRVETDGKRVTGRFIDLLERVGDWRGREITFGKDLDSIERTEEFGNIYTKLICLGPEDDEGNRLEIEVSDDDALRRWGRPHPITGELMHLEDTYEPTSERTDMTESELRQYGRTELNKRINSIVTYEAEVVDLENVPGMANKKIRFGDTVRIKDEKFNPHLYVEARIFEQRRDIFTKSNKRVKLGDFIEYTEDELRAVIDRLSKIIQTKVDATKLAEYTYNKITIDSKDNAVRTDVESYANTVSSEAKDEAITYTNNTVEPIIVTVDNVADDIDTLADDLSGQADLIVQAQTDITQNYNNINLKADSTTVEGVEVRVTSAEVDIDGLKGQIVLKADNTTVNEQGERITTAEQNISALDEEITSKVSTTEFNTLSGTVSNLESTVTQTAQDVQFAFDEIDDVGNKINNAVVTMDGNGVTVADGSFYLKDGDMKYNVVTKRNLIRDHSFERIVRAGGNVASDGTIAVGSGGVGAGSWGLIGSPRMMTAWDSGFLLSLYGYQSAVVNSTNYLHQDVSFYVGAGRTYTISADFFLSARSSSATPRLRVRMTRGSSGAAAQTWNQTFPIVNSSNSSRRHSMTFTIPNNAIIGTGANEIIVDIISNNSNWVAVDGVQLVEGSSPTTYYPEDETFLNLGEPGSPTPFPQGVSIGNVSMHNNTFLNNHGAIFIGGSGVGSTNAGGGNAAVRIGTDNYQGTGQASGLMYFGSDGTGQRIWSHSIYNRTYALSANMYITDQGTIGRATSARKYKTDIEPIQTEYAYNFFDNVHPVFYRPFNTADDNKEFSHYGYIADDVAPIEPRLVQFGQTGEPESFNYDRVPALLHVVLKNEIQRIDALETENQLLKNEIKIIKERMA